MAWTTVVAGTTITASWSNTNNRDQVISTFATTATRDAAITAPTEGLFSYQSDTNQITSYSGSAWSTVGPISGALTTWTPTITQSVTVTKTVTHGFYQRTGRLITAQCSLSCTSSGTVSNLISLTLPVTAASTADGALIGVFGISDTSATAFYSGFVTQANTGTICYFNIPTNNAAETTSRMGSAIFTGPLATGDVISCTITFVAAADA